MCVKRGGGEGGGVPVCVQVGMCLFFPLCLPLDMILQSKVTHIQNVTPDRHPNCQALLVCPHPPSMLFFYVESVCLSVCLSSMPELCVCVCVCVCARACACTRVCVCVRVYKCVYIAFCVC